LESGTKNEKVIEPVSRYHLVLSRCSPSEARQRGGQRFMAPRLCGGGKGVIICALFVSCALFLVLELDRPFAGLLRVSSAPLRDAASQVGN
jgi:hypothetical protein